MSALKPDVGPLPFALCRVAVVTLCGGLLFGYSTASIAGWLEPIAGEYGLGLSQQEYFTGSLVFCCFLGAAAAGPLARALGRRKTLALAFLLALAGYGLTSLHPDLFWLVAARMLMGLAVGLSSMAAPMYAGEATAPKNRGAVVSLFQLAVTLGILAAYAGPLIMTDPAAWPLAIGGGGMIAVAGLLALASVPESPVWLGGRGEKEEAARTARALGFDYEAPPARPAATPDFRALVSRGATMSVLMLCCGMFILQNLSGIDGILYYAPSIFIELGFAPGVAALGATFGLGLINVAATVVAIATVDRLGRRPLAIYGALVMVMGLSAVVVSHMWDLPMLGLVGLCVYIAAFALSLGPLPYVLMAELVPSQIRETGLAAASATSWLFNALVALFFLSGISLFGLAMVFGFFALVCVLALVVAVLWAPETKGRSLQDIERDVEAGVPLRRIGAAHA